MQGTERLALPAPRDRRWAILGPIAELLTAAADTWLHPAIILPLFFIGLTNSTPLIGLAVALLAAAWALGALPALPLERGAARTVSAISAVALRALTLFLLALAGALLAAQRPQLFTVAVALLVAGAFLSGFAEPLRRAQDASGGAAQRAPRWLLPGALAAVGAAIAARPFLADAGAIFPGRYLQLFALAALLLVPVAGALALRRPAVYATGAAPHHFPTRVNLPDLLLDNLAYGRLAVFRAAYAFGAIADPFYILYAARELGANGRTAGAYLLTLTVARAVAALVWRGLDAGGGHRMVLQLAAFVRLLAPIAALTLPPLLGSATVREYLPGANAASPIAFGLVFAAYGAAGAGIDVAGPTLQAALTTPRERPAAAMLTALVLAATAFTTLLGGLIVERLGYQFLFIAALMTGLLALLASGLVEEPHAFVRRAPQGERPITRRRVRATSDE